MNISRFLAKKYFFNKKKQGFVKVISIISVIGVMIGVLSLIVVYGVMNGFDEYLRERIVSITSDITLYPNISHDYDYFQDLRSDIEGLRGVSYATAVLEGNALIKTKHDAVGILMKGIEAEQSEKVMNLSQYIVEGRYDLSADNSIIIGYYLALNENIQVGDEIIIIPSNITSTPLGILPSFRKYIVKGIFKSGMYEFDYRYVYTNIASAQAVFGQHNRISYVEVKTENISRIERHYNEVSNFLWPRYIVQTFMDKNANLFAALKLEKLAMFIILSLIIAVASLNIASTLIVMVIQKTKDIGLFLSIGVSRKKIKKIFVTYGCIIGIIGSFLGTVFGLIIIYLLSKYQFFQLPGDIYYIEYFPVKLHYYHVIIINAVAFAISVFSTLIPAYKATKIQPNEALRNE